jgi:hypothetical protein
MVVYVIGNVSAERAYAVVRDRYEKDLREAEQAVKDFENS